MPIIHARAEISQAKADTITEHCGDMPLADYLHDALIIGLGHLQEEAILQERQSVYERHAPPANDFQATKTAAPRLALVPHHIEPE